MIDLKVKLENEVRKYQKLYALNELGQVVTKKRGHRVGTRIHNDYLHIGFTLYHRVVFALTHGYLTEKLDHKDRDTRNNAPDNLRPCTSLQNNINQGASKSNKLGIKGVCLDSRNSYNLKKPFRAYFAGCSISCEKLTEAMYLHDSFVLSVDKAFAVTHMSGLLKAFYVDWLYYHPEGKELRAEILAQVAKYSRTKPSLPTNKTIDLEAMSA